MIPAARKNLKELMSMQVRLGIPDGFSGAMTELENPIRNASLLGLLKYVAVTGADRRAPGVRISDALEDFGENLFRKMKDFTKVFKI